MANEITTNNDTVGYFNWVDTICTPCAVAYGDFDFTDYSTLTRADAIKDDGYTCDYCGKTFPVLSALQKVQTLEN